MNQPPEKPKFSLLNAMRSQSDAKKTIAVAAAPVAKTQPTRTLLQNGAASQQPKAGNLLGSAGQRTGDSTKDTKPVVAERLVDKQESTSSGGVDSNGNQQGVSVGEPSSEKPSLASVSAGGLLAKLSHQKERQEEIQATHEKMFNEEPKDFRQMLDYFDSLFEKDTGINEFNVAAGRDYVKIIFKQLKEDPALDGLMLDKDIGNIIDFVRKVKGIALDAGEKKKEAKVKKDSKAPAKSRFGNIGSLQLTTSAVASIEDLSDMGDLSL